MSLSYRDAGVDIDTGNALAARYTAMMESTFGPNVVRNDGGFGGLFSLQGLAGIHADAVLVSGADGVGTKLKVAFLLDKHDTVGIDLVAMSVNDVLVQGARPLFFLDYIGTGHCEKRVMLDLVAGVAEGCRQAGCALLGGETAEMPGFYPEGEYDLAGFAVGIVERRHLLDGSTVREGDVILGLPSSGLHSNGYSLARKALLEVGGHALADTLPGFTCTLGEELLRPTRLYTKPVLLALESFPDPCPVHGIVHITGGGLVENVPRILPKTCDAVFEESAWSSPPIFDAIAKAGEVERDEMRRVFNMGLGMVLLVDPASADAVRGMLLEAGEACHRVGEVVPGSGVVRYA